MAVFDDDEDDHHYYDHYDHYQLVVKIMNDDHVNKENKQQQ